PRARRGRRLRVRRAAGRPGGRRRARSGRRRALRGVLRAAAAARRRDRDRLGGRSLDAGRAGAARRPQRRARGLLSGTPAAPRAGARGRVGRRAPRAVADRRVLAARRRRAAARRGRAGARARGVASQRRQGRAPPVRALITGGRGGLGRAFAAALSDADVTLLDLPEFDVGDVDAWRSLDGEFDAAFLNAGVGIGVDDVSELGDEDYARIVRANFDGVVYGTRECAARLMPNGG